LPTFLFYMIDDTREKIREIAEPVVVYEGMELIHVECLRMHSGWIVRLYLDKKGGITLDDCAAISNQLGDLLDIHDLIKGRYTLEVSSPGFDRPISRDQDFIKYRGEQVNIKTGLKIEGIKNFQGTLVDIIDESGQKIILLELSGKTYRIPKADVIKANLKASDKLLSGK